MPTPRPLPEVRVSPECKTLDLAGGLVGFVSGGSPLRPLHCRASKLVRLYWTSIILGYTNGPSAPKPTRLDLDYLSKELIIIVTLTAITAK